MCRWLNGRTEECKNMSDLCNEMRGDEGSAEENAWNRKERVMTVFRELQRPTPLMNICVVRV